MKYNGQYGKFLVELGKKSGQVAVCEAAYKAYRACCEGTGVVSSNEVQNRALSLPRIQNGSIDLTQFGTSVLNWCKFVDAIGGLREEVTVNDKSYDMETYIDDSMLNPTDEWDTAVALFWSKIPVVSTRNGRIVADIYGTIERSIDNIISKNLYRFQPERVQEYRNYTDDELELNEPIGDNVETDDAGDVTIIDSPNPRMLSRLAKRAHKRLADAGFYGSDEYDRDDYVEELMDNMESILAGNVSSKWLTSFANALV